VGPGSGPPRNPRPVDALTPHQPEDTFGFRRSITRTPVDQTNTPPPNHHRPGGAAGAGAGGAEHLLEVRVLHLLLAVQRGLRGSRRLRRRGEGVSGGRGLQKRRNTFKKKSEANLTSSNIRMIGPEF